MNGGMTGLFSFSAHRYEETPGLKTRTCHDKLLSFGTRHIPQHFTGAVIDRPCQINYAWRR